VLTIRPRDNLIGKKLGDWRIERKVLRTLDQSGGYFSCGYEAVHEPTGRLGFVKAMDLHDAEYWSKVKGTSAFDEAYKLLRDYRFERDLLLRCRDENLSRIVVALEHDELELDSQNPLMSTVGYLVFDRAEGDVRTRISQHGFDTTWNIFVLKEVAVALLQLHSRGVVHQDLKPSNVLVFTQSDAKLADLGCAHIEALEESPRGLKSIPGDSTYAPIELLYRHVGDSWGRHLRTDLYLLGNFANFLFSGVSITALIEDNLEPEYHWDEYEGSYADVLPEVLRAFSQALELVGTDIDGEVRDEMIDLIRQLCHPDPERRGYVEGRSRACRQPYELRPFVARFANLAYKAGRGFIPISR
jgi:serine/threonine protein kinase